MDNPSEYLSNLARIKLKDSNEVLEGHIVHYSFSHEAILAKLTAMVRIRFNDEQKTEGVFSLGEIDTIVYL